MGMTLCIFDLVFLLVMNEGLRFAKDGLLDDCYRRPTKIRYFDIHKTKEVGLDLQWVDACSDATVVTTIFPKEAAQP
jgi:hypothetical protein